MSEKCDQGRVAALIVFTMLLQGCTAFIPYELAPYKTTTTTTRTETLTQPEIRLYPHSDGLGWNVRVVSTERQYQDVQLQEVWRGYRLENAIPTHPSFIAVAGLTCPIGILLSTFANPFIHSPATPIADKGFEFCVGWRSTSSQTTEIHQREFLRDHVVDTERLLTTGRLELRWITPNHDPLTVEVPVSQSPDGTAIRLTWLETVAARNASQLFREGSGYGEIVYRDHHTTAKSLYRISSDLLRATKSTTMWRAHQDRWPASIVVSLGERKEWDSESINDTWLSAIAQRLMERNISVVARGQDLNKLIQLQVNQLSPRYQDPHVDPGHLEPASILIRLSQTTSTDGIHLYATLIHLHNGTVLGSLNIEAPPQDTRLLLPTVAAVLPDLIQPNPPRREGWLIQ